MRESRVVVNGPGSSSHGARVARVWPGRMVCLRAMLVHTPHAIGPEYSPPSRLGRAPSKMHAFTNPFLPGRLSFSHVAADADCPPHGPAPGSPRADVPPPPGAVPVVLPLAGREVTRCPGGRPDAAPLAGPAA